MKSEVEGALWEFTEQSAVEFGFAEQFGARLMTKFAA